MASFPVQASKSDNISGGTMQTSVTLYDTGRLDGVTRTFTKVDFAGFTGGVIAVLLDQSGKPLWISSSHSYGVDGDATVFGRRVFGGTSDRTDSWSDQVPPEVLSTFKGMTILQSQDARFDLGEIVRSG